MQTPPLHTATATVVALQVAAQAPRAASKIDALLHKVRFLINFLYVYLFLVSMVVYGKTQQDSTVYQTLKAQYSQVIRDGATDTYRIAQNDFWGYADANGTVVVEPRYAQILPYSEGLAAVEFKGLWGYIDLDGEEVIPPLFTNSGSFSGGLAIVQYNGLWGYIAPDGERVVPCNYQAVRPFGISGRAIVQLHDKWGWIDRNGNVAIAIKFDALEEETLGLYRVKMNGQTFHINSLGNCVEDCYTEEALMASVTR